MLNFAIYYTSQINVLFYVNFCAEKYAFLCNLLIISPYYNISSYYKKHKRWLIIDKQSTIGNIEIAFGKLWAEIRRAIVYEFRVSESIEITTPTVSAYDELYNEPEYMPRRGHNSLNTKINNELIRTFHLIQTLFSSMLTTVYINNYNRANQSISIGVTQPKADALTAKDIYNALNAEHPQNSVFSSNFISALSAEQEKLYERISETIDDIYSTPNSFNINSSKVHKLIDTSMEIVKKILDTESEYFKSLGVIDCLKARGMKEYVFIASIDDRTSSICRSMHLKRIKVQDAKVGVNIPPLHFNCRSAIVPFDEIKFNETKERILNNNPSDVNIEERAYIQWILEYMSAYYPEYKQNIIVERKSDEKETDRKADSIDVMEAIHNLLDLIGFVPVEPVGIVADGINALLYLFEGNFINAGISALAMIPFASALKGLKHLENIASVLGVAGKKIVKEAIEAGLPEIAEKAIKEAMEETAERLGKEIAEEIAEETAGEITEKIAKEAAEELKEEIAEQLTETVSETIAEGAGKWNNGIRATQETIAGTNVPKSFVMEGKYVNGNEVWVHGNATKHMGEYINSAKGSVLVENEMMHSFKSTVAQVLKKQLQPGKNFFDNIGGWEIGINGDTGVIYHALMK